MRKSLLACGAASALILSSGLSTLSASGSQRAASTGPLNASRALGTTSADFNMAAVADPRTCVTHNSDGRPDADHDATEATDYMALGDVALALDDKFDDSPSYGGTFWDWRSSSVKVRSVPGPDSAALAKGVDEIAGAAHLSAPVQLIEGSSSLQQLRRLSRSIVADDSWAGAYAKGLNNAGVDVVCGLITVEGVAGGASVPR